MGRLILLVLGLFTAGCQVCKHPGDLCCAESRCEGGLTCSHELCVPAQPLTDVGRKCSENSTCQSGRCAEGFCSQPCETGGDCISGWACTDVPFSTARTCTCHPSGAEICDGKDNDCDGQVDGLKAQEVCQTTGGAWAACDGEAGCKCLGTMCSDTCVDLDTDPENCGSCGNSCPAVADGTAACLAGHCGRREVIQPGAIGGMFGIAADATDVFWSDGNNVCKTTIASKEIVYFAPTDSAANLLAADGNLYWMGDGTVSKQALDGGPTTTFGMHPRVFAVRGPRIAWADGDGIFAAPIAGGQATRLLTSPAPQPLAMAADDKRVYWMDVNGTLSSLPWEGGATTIVLGRGHPNLFVNRLAVDDDYLYWTSEGAYSWAFGSLIPPGTTGTSRVLKVAKGGGTPIVVADSSPALMLYAEVLVDDTDIYWGTLSPKAGGIMRVSKTGGAPVHLVTTPLLGMTDFTLDPGGIDYLGDNAAGADKGVFRVSPR